MITHLIRTVVRPCPLIMKLKQQMGSSTLWGPTPAQVKKNKNKKNINAVKELLCIIIWIKQNSMKY